MRATIMGHKRKGNCNIGQSIIRCAILCTVAFLLQTPNLFAGEMKGNGEYHNPDSNLMDMHDDSFKQIMLRDFHYYKYKVPTRKHSVNWLNSDFTLFINDQVKTITESELFEISYELYSKYYMQRIELYNIDGKAFLYLNLKDAQNNQGGLQFQLNLPNFRNLFRNNHNH